jgi:hypothetical protein
MDVLASWWMENAAWLIFFGVAVLLDLVSGVGIALYQGKFELEKLPQFLVQAALFLLGWLIAEAIALAPKALGVDPQGWDAILDGGPKVIYLAIVVGKYGGSLAKHLSVIMDLPLGVLYLVDQQAARAKAQTRKDGN